MPPTLKVNLKLVFTPDPDTELEEAIKDATTLEELKSALPGKSRLGKVRGVRGVHSEANN